MGKYINIASRCRVLLLKNLAASSLPRISDANRKWFNRFIFCQLGEEDTFLGRHTSIASYFEGREYSKAIKEIMLAADVANQYVDRMKPWALAKNRENDAELHQICSVALNMFRILTVYLKPVLPKLAEKAEQFLGVSPLTWKDANSQNRLLPDGHEINDYEHLMTRLDAKQIDALINANKETLQSSGQPPQTRPTEAMDKKTSTPSISDKNVGGRHRPVRLLSRSRILPRSISG